MEQKFFEFGGVRVGGDRGVEGFYRNDAFLASPLAMPSAGFSFSSFVADPLEFPLAPPDDPFSSLALSGPNSPASSLHSASTPIPLIDRLPLVQKPLDQMGQVQDLGAFDLEALGLSPSEFHPISALESTFQSPTHVTFEKVQAQFAPFQFQPTSSHPSVPTTPPPPSVSALSENDSSASSAQGDAIVCIDDFTTEELFEIMRSLDVELPPQDMPPFDTMAMGAPGYVSMSNALETIVSSSPIQTAPTQVAQSAGFGSVIVPNNLLAALPKNSTPDTLPDSAAAAAANVLTQQQLNELILPEDTVIVLKPDGSHLILSSSDVTLQLSQPQPQSVTVAAPTRDVTQSVARQKATLPSRQRVMPSAPLVTAPSYQELVTAPSYQELVTAPRYQERAALKRVRPRNESVSDKSEGNDPTWTPDDELDYAAPSRPKRMAVHRFPNLNVDDALDELEDEAGSSSEVSSYMKPLSPAKCPHKAGAKETGARSGRKSQAVPANRKERKRQQNREAAARYRQKKRTEHEDVEVSIEDVEAHNVELRRLVERARCECEAFKKAARLLFGPALDRMMVEARAQASAAHKSSHALVHYAKF
jgi:hypothetical protein